MGQNPVVCAVGNRPQRLITSWRSSSQLVWVCRQSIWAWPSFCLQRFASPLPDQRWKVHPVFIGAFEDVCFRLRAVGWGNRFGPEWCHRSDGRTPIGISSVFRLASSRICNPPSIFRCLSNISWPEARTSSTRWFRVVAFRFFWPRTWIWISFALLFFCRLPARPWWHLIQLCASTWCCRPGLGAHLWSFWSRQQQSPFLPFW